MHTRKQIMTKRKANHDAIDSRGSGPIVIDSVYYHIYAPHHSQRILFDNQDPSAPVLISNSTGRPVR